MSARLIVIGKGYGHEVIYYFIEETETSQISSLFKCPRLHASGLFQPCGFLSSAGIPNRWSVLPGAVQVSGRPFPGLWGLSSYVSLYITLGPFGTACKSVHMDIHAAFVGNVHPSTWHWWLSPGPGHCIYSVLKGSLKSHVQLDTRRG